ncbi:Sac domain-containing phosphoinositide 4-phosphatase 2 [Hyphodiscus hymeniophilus]|uniref:Sac domain-containing phosphoinositide 4-phosphatase 2 n=1 Tax=Hyphodiscus hymeniophilus TaxID=353542 RepID=A0A9P6VEB5_9HELO|nr:Sac domain-containing phosphoinositide 4-phosphatase 2 [Hyphodiscus hymeniophilus]
MPGLVRKVIIFAGFHGIVLQPVGAKKSQPSQVTYKDGSIGLAPRDNVEGGSSDKGFEAFGIVGLLTLSKSSFLISITRRQQVAQIQGKPVYVITEVALTPLRSKAEAEAAIAHTKASLRKRQVDGHAMDESDTEDDGVELSAGVSDDIEDEHVEMPSEDGPQSPTGHKRTSSVAEDVMARKGGYGRFAQKWFSKTGWTVGQRRNLGMSVSEPETEPEREREGTASIAAVPDLVSEGDPTPSVANVGGATEKDIADSLLPKLLRTTQILFGSRNFFFSYDYDITRSFANRRTTSSELPLHTEVDPLFFWNRNLIQPFINAGQAPFVLPLLQGFVGQLSFHMDTDPPISLDAAAKSSMELTDFSAGGAVDGAALGSERRRSGGSRQTEKSFLLTLISRRSVNRAGLRYLRRGVDEEGDTANSVETEQILSDLDWTPSSKIHSFVQIRGSVPIFFSQSPYSFKPVPQIQHSDETNAKAFKKHFEKISERYGSIQVASLVEKANNEAIVGRYYENKMDQMNESGGINGTQIGFEWFDFHAICRGMKFENVSLLMEAIGEKLEAFGDTVEANGQQLSRQSGVLRTNCMDCLDRTNVVQSAWGRRALEVQLKEEGIDMTLQLDQTTQWFNTLWADNGDAISKQYASTAAMKGDFTRTRKRDYKGALTDMGLSISRFYSGIVNDFFSQAVIDFLVGNVTSLIFEDFEANMMSGDPAVSMQNMRQQAIDVSQKLVIADQHEEFIAGWTLLTPHEPNTIKSTPFEEAVLLLTDSALYATRFDWNIEKVISFERIDLQHIVSIKYGTYITSTLSASQTDEQRNVGFVITSIPGSDDITRVNTRSLSSQVQPPRDEADLLRRSSTMTSPSAKGMAGLMSRPAAPPNRILAWKALPSKSAVSNGNDAPRLSEIETTKSICSEIERMVLLGKSVKDGTEKPSIVETGDIIGLSEARKSTGLFEQLGHGLKKMIWA